MTAVFSQHPWLQRAHESIRASRSAEYFKKADQFSNLLARPLGVEHPVELLTGTNMSALDRLFEDAPDTYHLNRIVTDMQALTDPLLAQTFTPSDQSLEQAVKTHVAFLTAQGYARLKDTGWADAWLQIWQQTMLRQNKQQFAYCSAAMSSEYRPPGCSDYGQAAECYLDMFSETGALGVTIIGALPFSAYASLGLLNSAADALEYLSPLLRMAQDVHVDTNEGLNIGIFAVASTQGLSAFDARSLIQEGAVVDLQDNLGEVYRSQRAKIKVALSARPLHEAIIALVETCFRMADQIAGVYPVN